MFLFEVKCLIWSAMEIEFFELHFLQPVLGGHPVLSGHLAIFRGWPLNTDLTLFVLSDGSTVRDRSVGVIYLVLLNLPREERFKWENVIVAGIIPEMTKEPKSLNTFLEQTVDAFKAFWKGVKLTTSQSEIPLAYRGAVILASADLPSVCKLCGFKGHSADRGCSKCFKYFPSSFGEKTDYSGFERDLWPPRHNRSHRIHAEMVRKASTQSKHDELAKKYGVYYSCLLKAWIFWCCEVHLYWSYAQSVPGNCKIGLQTLGKEFAKQEKSRDFRAKDSVVWCWNRKWMFAPQNCIKLWWLHCITVEKLDADIFLVLFKRSASRETQNLLADICSCLQVDMFSNHIQDWHCQSWSAFCKIGKLNETYL